MIKEHIEAIQKEIKEKHGVTASIDIKIYGNIYEKVDLEKAREIICDIQPAIESEIKADQSENYKWLFCQNHESKVGFYVWYEDEA